MHFLNRSQRKIVCLFNDGKLYSNFNDGNIFTHDLIIGNQFLDYDEVILHKKAQEHGRLIICKISSIWKSIP